MKIPAEVARSFYWVSQGLQGNVTIRQRLRYLTQTQYWAPETLRSYQLRKLQDLVRHSYDTVPYYRSLMDQHGLHPKDIQDFDDYRRFPILSREVLRSRGSDLRSRDASRDITCRQSSGSTGERVEFWQDRNFDQWCRAHQLRTYAWSGSWQLGEPFALVWGSPTYFESRSRANQLDNLLTNRIELNAFRLDQQSLQGILNRLIKHRPALISGYTTALYLLARLARTQGVAIPNLRAVQPTAEPLNDIMRSEIADGFGCEVFDKYGSRETNIIAHEDPDHTSLRIQAENTYVEFVDDDLQPCPPGTLGRVVVTTLNNRAMPLLRYQTSDLAAPIPIPKNSRLGLPAMTSVVGRAQDVLCTPEGGLIHPQLFSNVLRQFPEIVWFQAVQQREDELLLRVVPRPSLEESAAANIASLIHKLTGFRFQTKFELLQDMPESETGKFRLCIYDLPVSQQDQRLRALNDLRAAE